MKKITIKYFLNSTLSPIFQINSFKREKFEQDSLNIDNNYCTCFIDGVILNKSKLIQEFKQPNWESTVLFMYSKLGMGSFKLLKGSYTIFFYDKIVNKLFIQSDHIGTKPIYYSKVGELFYCSNNYYELISLLKKDGLKLSLNLDASYLILTYGFVYEEKTLVNEIKRLRIGHFGTIQSNSFSEHKFWELKNPEKQLNEHEAIEGIDYHFRNAITLAFEKDIEYGFNHLVSLSGGLDSRMTSWVAHEMGFEDQVNITFSQSDYLDETIPKKIASELKHDWIFKSLDNGMFLKSIDKITKVTGGNVLYYGLAHADSLYKYLDFENLGILHTGQLGDVIFSSFNKDVKQNKNFSTGGGAYSVNLISRLDKNIVSGTYENEEIYKMYIRGFYGANHGLLSAMNYTETYSPFYDIDTITYSMTIPLRYRANHELYKKWILTKYPQAANFIWESAKSKINDRHITIKNKPVPINQIPYKILAKIGLIKNPLNTPYHMNPLSYWYNTNHIIRQFQDEYFDENIIRLNDWFELKQDCINLYNTGTGVEKNQVLSLLAGCKLLFGEY